MNTTKDEKICSFFASDYHFEMISLPYIQKGLKEDRKVIVFSENNLEKTINKVLNGMNLNKDVKDKILEINWGNNDFEKFDELKNLKNENNKLLIFVKGKENYIKDIETKFLKIDNESEMEIVDCYDVNELGNDTANIAEKYDKVLNTVGKILLN